MNFNNFIKHRVQMDRKEYTIESVFSTHTGGLVAVKMSSKNGDKVEHEHFMSNILKMKIDSGQATLLPPETEEVKLGSKV